MKDPGGNRMKNHNEVISRREMLRRSAGLGALAFAGVVGPALGEQRQGVNASESLNEKALTENHELDQRLLDAHKLKDADMVVSLFSASADVFFISPGGMLSKGRDEIHKSFQDFFDMLASIRGEIQSITYIPAGDGVIAQGRVFYYRHIKKAPKDAPAEQKTVIWTDYRRVEDGKWVYLFRHAHWPVEISNSAKPT
jgi:ketosteroid isomerase-like protein